MMGNFLRRLTGLWRTADHRVSDIVTETETKGTTGHVQAPIHVAATSVSDLHTLDIDSLPSRHPLDVFSCWFHEAQTTEGVHLATSATLATASRSGKPACRIVGVKGFDVEGFKIATNSKSQKAIEMDENPQASIMFYWESLNKMVRVEGTVHKLSDAEADEIWKAFPLEAKVTHTASKQDDVLTSREAFTARKVEVAAQYRDREVPRNPQWCAYNLAVKRWEFYQGNNDFPDRLVFRPLKPGEVPDGVTVHSAQAGLAIERLSP